MVLKQELPLRIIPLGGNSTIEIKLNACGARGQKRFKYKGCIGKQQAHVRVKNIDY